MCRSSKTVSTCRTARGTHGRGVLRMRAGRRWTRFPCHLRSNPHTVPRGETQVRNRRRTNRRVSRPAVRICLLRERNIIRNIRPRLRTSRSASTSASSPVPAQSPRVSSAREERLVEEPTLSETKKLAADRKRAESAQVCTSPCGLKSRVPKSALSRLDCEPGGLQQRHGSRTPMEIQSWRTGPQRMCRHRHSLRPRSTSRSALKLGGRAKQPPPPGLRKRRRSRRRRSPRSRYMKARGCISERLKFARCCRSRSSRNRR